MTATGELSVNPRFQLLRRLGEGAMGVVYEAIDRHRNHRVALKTLSRAEPEAIYYLKNEFRALADVVHPNLVGIHELFAEGDSWFFTMELIDGVSFVEHVRDAAAVSLSFTATHGHSEAAPPPVWRRGTVESPSRDGVLGRVDFAELRNAMQQLVNGVQAIHDAGKLHRDLKPSNVLVTRDRRVKILDFGFVSGTAPGSIGETIASSGITGTPAYMAPEQAGGDRATPASDWYAVGVILYESLTGRLPFGGSVFDVLMAKQRRLPARPREVDPALPEHLDELCMALLQIAPEDRPTGAEVLLRLGSGTSTAARIASDVGEHTAMRVPVAAPFVGRAQQLAELISALDATESGSPLLVRLHGLSGMGKSALLKRFAELAQHDRGALVLEGRCYERESVPFKGLDGIIDSITRHLRRLSQVHAARILPRNIQALARLFPVFQRIEAVLSAPHRRALPPDPMELRRRAIAALGDLLTRLHDELPLVVSIDDFQWADADSVALLRELLTLPEPPGCLFVLAYRSDETAHSEALKALSLFVQDGSVPERTVEVGGLAESEVSELVQSLAKSPPALSPHQLWAESQGSPYFVQELIESALRAGDGALPENARLSLDETLRARVAQLRPEERDFLELLAVAGRPTPRNVLRAALGLSDDVHVVRQLRAVSFVRASDRDTVESYHDRVREAVVDGLPLHEQRELHARLAVVLVHHRADPELVAEHFHAAGQKERASEYAMLAGQRASDALAFDRAVRFYRMAIELLPEHAGVEVAGIWRKLAEALANAGRPMEAAAAYQQTASLVHGSEAARMHSFAAAQRLLAGHVDQGIAGVRASLEEYGIVIPREPFEQFDAARRTMREVRIRAEQLLAAPSWVAEADLSLEERTRLELLEAAVLGLCGYDFSPFSGYLGSQSALASITALEPARCLRSLNLSCYAIRAVGGAPSPSFEHMMALAREQMSNPLARAWQMFDEGSAAHWRMDGPAALRALMEAEEIFSNQCHGVARELGFVRFLLVASLTLAGRVRDRVRICEDWQRLARERGDFFLELWMTIFGWRHLCADDPRVQEREIEQALERFAALGTDPSQSIVGVVHMLATMALSDVDRYAGQADRSLARINAFSERWALAPLVAWVPLHRRILRLYEALGLAAVASSSSTWSDALAARATSITDELTVSEHPLESALGHTLLAAVSKRGGNLIAIERMRIAADRMESWSPVWFHCAQRQYGRLRGGPEGQEFVRAADQVLRDEGITNPERWANMWVPCF